MITVIKTPLGHKLSDNILSGTVTNSSGDALVTTSVSHGLSDGDHIYIDSNIGSYNGFRYVDSVSYNTFKIKESEDGAYIAYKQSVDISYQVSVVQHGVQCVHLPIVYEMESSLFPNNQEEEAYVPNVVASFHDYVGYTRIVLTGELTDPVKLSKIELVGFGPLSGVYQILQVLNGSEVVIDLDYDAGNSFSGYTVVKYYDNYAINVNIYGGLISGHPWEDEKPVELLATLKLIPDDNNRVLFSINDYLRSQINTINDLTIDTFPNNIHFMTEFYIGYFESYDVSDGEDISTYQANETIDSFVGQAVNAKNEFKNIYSGHLSEYVSDEDSPAQWLTDFENPIAIVGYFFDASFFNPYNSDLTVNIFKRSGEAVVQETQTIDNPGVGIIRLEIEPESGYDEYCVEVSTPGTPGSTESIVLPDLAEWESANISGALEDWVEGATPQVTLPYGGGIFHDSTSEFIYVDYPFVEGTEYTIVIDFSMIPPPGPGTQPSLSGSVFILDGSFNEIATGNSSNTLSSVTFTAGSNTTRIGFKVFRALGTRTGDASASIQSVSGSQTIEEIPAQQITEQLCITVLEECDSTLIGDLRELEGGEFRLLE